MVNHMCFTQTLTYHLRPQARSETHGWGGAKFQNDFIVSGASWGPNLKKVD